MNFEKNLVLIRKRANYSQEALAFAIGVSRQTIYSWEAGLNSPSILMLKKLAHVLSVSTDDLLNGYSVEKLPDKLPEIKLSYIADMKEEYKYEEVPNWYIKLKCGEEVCFGLYDNGKKDYSYHLAINNKVMVHGQEGYEIELKEYDSKLNETDTFSLLAREENNEIYFIGKISYKDGIKNIQTYMDKEFLKYWGFSDGEFRGQGMLYSNAKRYLLEYGGIKEEVIGISYFDQENTNDLKHSYFEVFLNQAGESLYWKRYVKSERGKHLVEGVPYELSYENITSRFIK